MGDTLLAGSFVVSGSVHARAEHVSGDNYISKISASAKTVKKQVNSEIMRTMQAIVTVISVALIPISIILFRNQLALAGCHHAKRRAEHHRRADRHGARGPDAADLHGAGRLGGTPVPASM